MELLKVSFKAVAESYAFHRDSRELEVLLGVGGKTVLVLHEDVIHILGSLVAVSKDTRRDGKLAIRIALAAEHDMSCVVQGAVVLKVGSFPTSHLTPTLLPCIPSLICFVNLPDLPFLPLSNQLIDALSKCLILTIANRHDLTLGQETCVCPLLSLLISPRHLFLLPYSIQHIGGIPRLHAVSALRIFLLFASVKTICHSSHFFITLLGKVTAGPDSLRR
ncbi:hypothetical protein E2C01_035770 [Portunus trituberculatus]|uniref:Uncharacterized protein n=1 Tax=Portunus trituberculatus TaxID=210409 RepID=A0A5B7F9C1_PORTR|nr:hypothetical protein [Portunus trituberculatus]